MNSDLASLMPGFIVDNLRNSPAITRNCRLESEHKESQSPSSIFNQRFPKDKISEMQLGAG